MNENWLPVCRDDAIEEEDLIRFDYGERTFCVYNTPAGLYASDGLCTHEAQHLKDGFVIGTVIECPLHQGRFDVRTGEALDGPVCIDLRTYPVKVVGGHVYLDVGPSQ